MICHICVKNQYANRCPDESKPVPEGYKPRMCYFGICGWPKSGPAYLGIPREACVVEEKEAAAIFARWKGSYRLASIAPGPEEGGGVPLASFTDVYIGDDGMRFSGGTHLHSFSGTGSGGSGGYTDTVGNETYPHKLVLRRVADGELYLDNFGSRILEESPGELRIELYQGGKIVLTKA